MAGSTRAPSSTPRTDWCDVLGDEVDQIIRPAFIGYADGATFHTWAPNTARPLGADDAAHVAELQAACGALEWEHGGSELGQNLAAGVYISERLVALTGSEVLGGIAHTSVITHPPISGEGLRRRDRQHTHRNRAGAGPCAAIPYTRKQCHVDARGPQVRVCALRRQYSCVPAPADHLIRTCGGPTTAKCRNRPMTPRRPRASHRKLP
jgi:hypothetical protein